MDTPERKMRDIPMLDIDRERMRAEFDGFDNMTPKEFLVATQQRLRAIASLIRSLKLHNWSELEVGMKVKVLGEPADVDDPEVGTIGTVIEGPSEYDHEVGVMFDNGQMVYYETYELELVT